MSQIPRSNAAGYLTLAGTLGWCKQACPSSLCLRGNNWYIEKMEYIFISADGPVYVMLVPDNIANDLREFVNLYYHQCYYKHAELEPFDLMDDFLEFIKRKCPEHPGKIVDIIDCENYEEEKQALKQYNYKESCSWNF